MIRRRGRRHGFRFSRHGPRRTGILAVAMVALSIAASWALLVPPTEAVGTPGTATLVTVALSPTSIVANGTSTTMATATVTDASDSPVSGETVVFTSTDSAEAISSTTDNGDGTYTATITSSTTLGTPTITATDSTSGGIFGTATLTQTSVATGVALALNPTSIVANGTSTSTATATVTGDPTGQDTVTFSTTGSQTISPVTNVGNGTYTATITSSTTIGPSTITATDTSTAPTISAAATLTQTSAATGVTVSLNPTTIVASGTSTTTATAIVTGDPTGQDTVTFTSSDPEQLIGPVTDEGNGTYTATITSSTTAGPSTITATDTSAAPTISGAATLTQTTGVTGVAVALNPASIVANGTSTTTATATIAGDPFGQDAVTFASSDPGQTIGPVINDGNGTYTAIITSSTTSGPSTITVTDTTAGTSGTTILTQTSAATSIAVTLSPAAIVANGTSTTAATATVSATGIGPISGDAVVFTSSAVPGQMFPATSEGNGTYTARVRSSTAVGTATITATDTSVNPSISGTATLDQALAATTTTLSVPPAALVTNQKVTLSETTAISPGTVASHLSGKITFDDHGALIGGCTVALPPSQTSVTTTCQASFAASTSPEQLTAAFTSGNGKSVADSTSAPVTLNIGRDSTTTSLDASKLSVQVGAPTTYTATVTPAHPGPTEPSGSVKFMDGKTPIPSCLSRPVTTSGSFSTATCTVSYRHAGKHTITAAYAGDASFDRSTSQAVIVHATPFRPRGTITSTMHWTFYYTPGYTRVLAFVVDQVPVGATVLEKCSGGGCPFVTRSTLVAGGKPCSSHPHKKCSRPKPRTVNLLAGFTRHRLRPGAQIAVAITRPRYIGKFYVFKVRAGHPPRISIR